MLAKMYLQTLFFLLLVKSSAKPVVNVSIIGSVFCDSCSENTYTKRSYFLKGAEVNIHCKFGDTTVAAANTTTDKYGVYKLDIRLHHQYRCSLKPVCRANMIRSPPSPCNLPGIMISTNHIAVKPKKNGNACLLNMKAMSSRPLARDAGYCGVQRVQSGELDSSMCFWPIYPPIGLPWLHWPPLPSVLPFPFNSIPLPDPSSLPFSLPPWLLPFLDPASLPFPFSLFPPPNSSHYHAKP